MFWTSSDEKTAFLAKYSQLTRDIGNMNIFLNKVRNSEKTMTLEEQQEVETYLNILNLIIDAFDKRLDNCIDLLSN